MTTAFIVVVVLGALALIFFVAAWQLMCWLDEAEAVIEDASDTIAEEWGTGLDYVYRIPLELRRGR